VFVAVLFEETALENFVDPFAGACKDTGDDAAVFNELVFKNYAMGAYA